MAEFDRVCLVLVATRNPLNIGAAARAMSNFGFRRLRVVKPYAPAFREARSAVGGAELLASAEEYASVAEAVADCTLVVGTSAVRHRELQHPVQRLEEGASVIRKQLACGPVAILFGSEKVGLSNADLSHCHWVMRIPTQEHASMNLGQAVAICLYELVRERKSERRSVVPTLRQHRAKGWAAPAAAGDVERITEVLLDALRASGYLKPRSSAATEEKIRRLVRRLKLEADDAETWLGMLRQMLWKMTSGADD
jgi:TrmH family RNA methyltransferase